MRRRRGWGVCGRGGRRGGYRGGDRTRGPVQRPDDLLVRFCSEALTVTVFFFLTSSFCRLRFVSFSPLPRFVECCTYPGLFIDGLFGGYRSARHGGLVLGCGGSLSTLWRGGLELSRAAGGFGPRVVDDGGSALARGCHGVRDPLESVDWTLELSMDAGEGLDRSNAVLDGY